MKKEPIFWIFIMTILGIVFQDQFLLPAKIVYPLFAGLTALTVGSIFLKRFSALLVLISFFFLGVFLHFLNSQRQEIPNFSGKQEFYFSVEKKLKSSVKNQKYIIQILAVRGQSELTYPIRALFYQPKDSRTLDFAHQYLTQAYLNKIPPPNTDYHFDFQKYMQRQNVELQVFSKSKLHSRSVPLTPVSWIKQQHATTVQKINEMNISKDSREFMKGIILADKTDMDEKMFQDFSKSGLAHLLAISGTHMVIIFFFVFWIFKKITPSKKHRIAILFSLIFIWVFAIFIDYGNSVVRACIMLTVYYIMVLLQRKTDLLHSLGLAGLIILLCNTQQLFSVGFQLSFLAVFGIYWLNGPISRFFPKVRSAWKSTLFSILSITISAQIITLPLVLFYFHQFSFISLVSNLLVLPAAEIIIVFSLVLTSMVALGINMPWMDGLYDFLISNLLKLIHFLAEIDSLFFENISMHWLEVLAAFLLIYFLRFLLIHRNWKFTLRFVGSILLFFGIKLFLDYRSYQINETLIHNYKKMDIYSVKNGNHLIFYGPQGWKPDESFEKYYAKPYSTSVRVKNYEFSEVKTSVNELEK